jgi:PhoH-like ATPase
LNNVGKSTSKIDNLNFLQVEALSYTRGRTIPHQVIIVDEAQNLTPHEIKTIVTRAGVGTKVILTGDISQIDSPYLDSMSNGLSYSTAKFADQEIAGHLTLSYGVRSELSNLASKIL